MASRLSRFSAPALRYLRYALAAAAALLPASGASAFGLDDVVARAQELAQQSYEPPRAAPEIMLRMGYDQHRGIRYRTEHNLWRAAHSRLQVSPLIPGNVYTHIVPINVVDGSTVERLAFNKEHFEFDDPQLERRIPDELGYAGFELSYPLRGSGEQDEFLSFAGASYFRAIDLGGQWGLSARGAAIDTGLASGEEFPNFIEFWLVRPRPRADSMTVYALLDSPRLAGAYEFSIAPGAPTRVDVTAVLFVRERIEQLGLAPLTSMYFYGENTPRPRHAWRPEVHDSDGLLIRTATGEWVWRPLVNPATITIESHAAGNVFGLFQRDQRFASYQDAETNYHRRPSAVARLQSGFEGGQVRLVQLPTSNEFMDNIVAFWSPPGAVAAGSRIEAAWQLRFGREAMVRTGLARVVDTFVGRDVIAATSAADQYRFIVDFSGARLDDLNADAPLAAVIGAAPTTQILQHHLERIEPTGSWRLSILARADADEPLALHAALSLNNRPLTETWSYRLEAGNAVRKHE